MTIQDYHPHEAERGGIWCPVYLEATDKTSVEHIVVSVQKENGDF